MERGEDMPSVRLLRELYARGMADLQARGEIESTDLDSATHLRELYARGMAELQAREAEAQAEAEQKS